MSNVAFRWLGHNIEEAHTFMQSRVVWGPDDGGSNRLYLAPNKPFGGELYAIEGDWVIKQADGTFIATQEIKRNINSMA